MTKTASKHAVIPNKAAIIGFAYFAGTAFTASELLPITALTGFFAVCIIAAFVLGLLQKASGIALALFAVSCGVLTFTVYDYTVRQPILANVNETAETGLSLSDLAESAEPKAPQEQPQTALRGKVISIKTTLFEKAFYTLDCELNGIKTRIILNAPDYAIYPGDVVEATDITLSHFQNTALFPERTYNHAKGILLKADTDQLSLVEKGKPNLLTHIESNSEQLKDKLQRAFSREISGMLIAAFFGDKSGLNAEQSYQLRIAGAMHYTAVSGLHLTLIIHMFVLMLSLTPIGRFRIVRFIAIVGAIAVLVVFFAFSKSVMRSAIMLLIYYSGELAMRRRNTLNSLGTALFILLIAEPYAVFDIGLLMSFSGTMGVGVVSPIVTQRTRNKLIKNMATSACAAVCVLPVSALTFGGVSLLAPITSVVILPFFTVAVLSTVLYALSPIAALGQGFLLLSGLAAKAMCEIANFFGAFTAAWVSLDYWFLPIWIALAVIATAVVGILCKSKVKAVKAAALAIATLAVMICSYNTYAAKSGRVYISILSDNVAAWVTANHHGKTVVVSTTDTPNAFEHIRIENNSLSAFALLGSNRNNVRAFDKLNTEFSVMPDSEAALYDINGQFLLDVRPKTRRISGTVAMLTIGDVRILLTPATNDYAESDAAEVVVAYGRVFNKRNFNAGSVVYATRSIAIETDNEYNAYYEPIRFVLR